VLVMVVGCLQPPKVGVVVATARPLGAFPALVVGFRNRPKSAAGRQRREVLEVAVSCRQRPNVGVGAATEWPRLAVPAVLFDCRHQPMLGVGATTAWPRGLSSPPVTTSVPSGCPTPPDTASGDCLMGPSRSPYSSG